MVLTIHLAKHLPTEMGQTGLDREGSRTPNYDENTNGE